MKKIISTVALLAVSLSYANAYTTSQLDSANILADQGIINDKSLTPTEYNLDQNVLRQEIAAVARGVAGISKISSCSSSFSDVSATNPNTWACFSIEALLNADLIASNSTFRPEANITKAEGLGMLVKAACGDEYSYDSSTSGTWQEQVVSYASDKLIVSSFTDYDTAATRGWVFETGANAMKSCSNIVGNESLDIDALKDSCSGKAKIDNFETLSGCTGGKTNYYFISEKEVSKEVYDLEYADYTEYGPLCEVDEVLEEGTMKSICKKGEYATYYVSGEEVTYEYFMIAIFATAQGMIVDELVEERRLIDDEKKDALSSFSAFKGSLTDSEIFEGEVSYTEVGDACPVMFSRSKVLINGVGYEVTCENSSVSHVDYYYDSNEVPVLLYLKYMYNNLRKIYVDE